MRFHHSRAGHLITAVVFLLCVSAITASADTLSHTTQTDFAPGSFFQTVLEGTEGNPEIRLGSYGFLNWTLDDDDIDGWYYDTNESVNIATEDPEGQIHLYSLFQSSPSGSWSYASRSDIDIPDRCSVEFLVYIDAMDSSGVEDPFVDQPTGACCRLDVLRTDVGFRMEIFRDRMTSYYRQGTSGIDYPITASIDTVTNIGQWYTFRFDIDFNDPDLIVDVYRDDAWLGELKADVQNSVPTRKIRPLSFSRLAVSGPAEFHVDRVRLAVEDSTYYSTGSYTSEVIELNASSFDTFSWKELSTSPYPWQGWVKYEGNPITGSPSLPENMLVDIDDPLQQPIQYNGKYWLCYSTGSPQHIHLAYTTDPELLVWTDYEGNPVIAPGAGEDYVFSPNLFKLDTIYYMVYDVQLSSDHHQRLTYATAPAPTGPFTKGQIILELGAPGEWDDLRVTEPFVFKEGGTYFMYYMGDHGCGGCAEQIGLATTPDSLFPLGPETGGLWTKHGLVLPHNPDPNGWDRGLTADPSVIKVGDVFFMRYTGSYANEHWELGTAWATDPHGPWHRPDAPDIERGPPGSWDDDKLVRGAIHYHNGKYYSPYTGSSGSGSWLNYQGGMATSDPRTLEDSLLFETRVSPDGLEWEDWRPVINGVPVQSTPCRYFQYRATFNLNAADLSPTLTEVAVKYNMSYTSVEETPLPFIARLHRPFPNPFNPGTVIGFTVNRRQAVRIFVYDASGRRVARLTDRTFDAGRHEVIWNGTNIEGRAVSSGVYFVSMEAERHRAVRRAVLIR
jgi:hypothetical protein